MMNFEISGMTCGGCSRSIAAAIHAIDAKAKVEADVPSRRVSVETNAKENALLEAIRDAGYEAKLI